MPLPILIVSLFLVLIKATSVREYCDEHVYEQANKPVFGGQPGEYVLPYFKRCVNHEEWVRCVRAFSENPTENFTVQPYEKETPAESDMLASGMLFCAVNLPLIPIDIKCTVNRIKCDVVPKYQDACDAGIKRVDCMWEQFKECKQEDKLSFLKQYEYGLLGGKCLYEKNVINHPPLQRSKECKRSFGSGTTVKASEELLVLAIGLYIVFASFSDASILLSLLL